MDYRASYRLAELLFWWRFWKVLSQKGEEEILTLKRLNEKRRWSARLRICFAILKSSQTTIDYWEFGSTKASGCLLLWILALHSHPLCRNISDISLLCVHKLRVSWLINVILLKIHALCREHELKDEMRDISSEIFPRFYIQIVSGSLINSNLKLLLKYSRIYKEICT